MRKLLMILFLCLLTSCGLFSKNSELDVKAPPSDTDEGTATLQGKPIPYHTKIIVQGTKADNYLESLMKDASHLLKYANKAPDSLLGLESRARSDTENAVQLLHSQCYYDGTASFEIDEQASPVKITLTLIPGQRYTLGRASVTYDPVPVVPDAFKRRIKKTGLLGLDEEFIPPPSFPDVLPDVEIGQPVTAEVMLAAVETLPLLFRKDGYPLAKVKEAVYTLDRDAKLLNADIVVDVGPAARFGEIRVSGTKGVNDCLIQRLVPWTTGQETWNDDKLEDFANQLRSSGLFRSVQTKPATEDLKTDQEGIAVLPVDMEVKEAPFRTLSANVHYSTDTGFGVEGGWEHRNLFHNGERLTIVAPIATEMRGIKANFLKPAFLDREQNLVANASVLREDTNAYQKTSASAYGGVERKLAPFLWAGIGLYGEGGSLKENEKSEESYEVYGPRVYLRRDSRDNKMNPTTGSELKFTVFPFTGSYTESFSALSATLGFSAYYAPLGHYPDGKINDKIILAGHVEGGGMSGASLRNLPPSVRYYTGGAGSVRGYTYQSIGPRDNEDDPLGGRSYQVVNLEARYKITNEVGIVPFVDGGMVYKDELPRIIGDMRWGGGLGLRYYTPIGPLRLDVATPFNPIEGDPLVQLYISLGQSF